MKNLKNATYSDAKVEQDVKEEFLEDFELLKTIGYYLSLSS